MIIAYECSNPACGYLSSVDPQGHCPRCKRADGSGYSTVPVEAVKCGWCDNPMLPGSALDRCQDCQAAIEYAMGTH